MLLDRVAALAGGRADVFERAPQERARYVALGSVIVATGVFAALSGTYALAMALSAPLWAVAPLGLLWGAVVVFIDRALLFSISRRQRWWVNLVLAVPRLGIALLLGAIISTPLVLQVLHTEVGREVVDLQLRQRTEHNQMADAAFARQQEIQAAIQVNEELISAGGFGESVTDQQDVKDAQAALTSAQAAYDAAARAADCEESGGCGSGRAGQGPVFNAKEAERQVAATALQQAQGDYDAALRAAQARVADGASAVVLAAREDLATQQRALEDLEAERSASDAAFDAQAGGVGLLDRNRALNALAARDEGARDLKEGLLAIFVIVEFTPVFMKIVMVMTNADKNYQDIADLLDGRSVLATSKWNDAEASVTDIKIAAYQRSVADEQTRREEVVRKANATVAEVQRAVVDASLARWRDMVTDNPGATPPTPHAAPAPRAPQSNPSPSLDDDMDHINLPNTSLSGWTAHQPGNGS